MKKEHYCFDVTSEAYNFIMSSNILKESKKEKTIFDMCRSGKSIKEISLVTGYSDRTVNRRKEIIYNKLKNYLSCEELEDYNDKKYKVYILIFPNNKVYVGQTQNTKQRWNNGMGYIQNKVMFEDIMTYGWNNITKKIVYDNLTFEQSLEKEKELIIHYKSNISSYGYNKEF